MKRHPILVLVLLALLLGFMLLELTTGPAAVPFTEVITSLFAEDSRHHVIVWDLRFPRMLYAVCLGVGLSLCGLSLQGLFRNPLADPFTLGISGGAAFGAAFVVMLGFENSGVTISLAAFGGAMLSCVVVYTLAERALFSKTALILGGVMIGYFFQSGLMLTISLSSSQRAHGVIVWLMGDLGSASTDLLFPTLTLTILGAFFLQRRANGLNVLAMGDEKALSLGENVKALRRSVFIWSSVVTGACVAAVGIVGFVGLMIPHALRRFVGPNHRVLFPFCALGGAVFALLCDLASRLVFAPIEIPLGVITGFIGSLMFLWIFLVKRAS